MIKFEPREVKGNVVEVNADRFNELMLDSLKYAFALNGLKNNVPAEYIIAMLEEEEDNEP